VLICLSVFIFIVFYNLFSASSLYHSSLYNYSSHLPHLFNRSFIDLLTLSWSLFIRFTVMSSLHFFLLLWCSSWYLRISPLHQEFRSPLNTSSLPVSEARSQLSCKFSLPTQQTAYEPFTPNNSGQRSDPTYYRGCWHVVGRSFFCTYRHHRYWRFVGTERGLQPEGRHPSRGVAGSGFRPLSNIPHCCLP